MKQNGKTARSPSGKLPDSGARRGVPNAHPHGSPPLRGGNVGMAHQEVAGIRREPAASTGLHHIAGRHNPRLKQLRTAFRRGELTSNAECAIEGVKLVEEALRSGQRVTGVFFSESAASQADKLLPQISSKVEPLLLPDSLFRSIVPSESPQGVAALVKMRTWSAGQLLERSELGVFVVAAGIQDPGNLGTILRSAEAFGAAGIFLSEGTVSVFNSKVLRGSAGSVFRLPFLHIPSSELIPLLKQRGVRLRSTSSHHGTSLSEVSWTLPVAVFIGNEGAGLPRALMHQMDESILIPHSPQVESLNAGVAASIVLYQARNSSSPQSHRDTEEHRV